MENHQTTMYCQRNLSLFVMLLTIFKGIISVYYFRNQYMGLKYRFTLSNTLIGSVNIRLLCFQS